jgi:hypothetical protein
MKLGQKVTVRLLAYNAIIKGRIRAIAGGRVLLELDDIVEVKNFCGGIDYIGWHCSQEEHELNGYDLNKYYWWILEKEIVKKKKIKPLSIE